MEDQIPPLLECPIGIGKGNLSMQPSKKNILTLCEHIFYRFVRPSGIFNQPLPQWGDIPSNFVVKKYGKLNKEVNTTEVHSGNSLLLSDSYPYDWSYLISGTLHRFLYHDFHLFRSECSLLSNKFHWWLQDDHGSIIDLTEEQYLLHDINNCRYNYSRQDPLGLSHSITTKNVAFTIVNDLCREYVDINKISTINYQNQ